jgi:tRNA pseudouridine38-40 synthase
MSRFAFKIKYNGKNYFGWQKQLNQISIQEKIEKALNQLYNSTGIEIVGCGRTDTGVHANDYTFHVDLTEKYELETVHFKLNRMLPDDICIVSSRKTEENFHARFDAKSRTYRYFIHFNKDPFINDFSLYQHQMLDFEKMNEAAKLLIGKKDFTSFSKLHTDVKNNICEVIEAKWELIDDNKAYFQIKANRFLRNMVRACVGTLIEIGSEKINNDDLQKIINAQNRSEAKLSVPAHGLFLWSVEY